MWNDFQHLSNSLRTASHEFEQQSVHWLYSPENDLVHSLLFENIKIGFYFGSKQLAQHWRITWIGKIRIEIVFGKIEKCQQAGKANKFCLRFAPFGELVHEIKHVIYGQII